MESKRGIDPLHYSTAGIAPAARHSTWSERGWPSVAAMFESTPLGEFSTSSDLVMLGQVMVSYAEGTARQLHRTPAKIAEDGMDAFCVGILLEGTMRGDAAGRTFEAGGGEILLLDALQPSSVLISTSRSIQLGMPRAVAIEAGFEVAALHGFVVNAAAAAMLVSHLKRIREALPQLSQEEGPRVARTLLDMLALAVNAASRWVTASEEIKASPQARARREIEEHLGSASLSVANLCRRLNISRSTLHRLFADEGGVQAFIRTSRLDAARLALLDPANEERIGVIAERLGFSDAAHLSRLFRSHYGETPSDCRGRARSGAKSGAGTT